MNLVSNVRWRTLLAPSGIADLRARTSTSVVVGGITDAATCAPSDPPCSVTVQGTTLEQPPSQPNGSAFNGSMSAGVISLDTPLGDGESINLRFLLGIQQTGSFKFYINVESLQDVPMVEASSLKLKGRFK